MATNKALKAKNKKLKNKLRNARLDMRKYLSDNDILTHKLYMAEHKFDVLIENIKALADHFETEDDDAHNLEILDAVIEEINAKVDKKGDVVRADPTNRPDVYADFLGGENPQANCNPLSDREVVPVVAPITAAVAN